ncbi:class I SAM-dependent methyltransferase [Aeromicrobium sp. A1-2]|uniref:class I SAM-dependent methyltransferase n=1 Tax=Aeromicrobium sp. A1-2 TaxID=2107713 RepID=UPI0013C2D8C8|nr:class I SAM-dependent methyltransferase [Aeromicrobium sp. A1-2]
MNDSPEDRTAKWLVGDRLACVLHLGDAALAYQLAEQGHEVLVAGDDVTASRHPDIQYVRTRGERLPFLAEAFDVVIAPELREPPTALAEYARVLRPDGLVSTISQRYDDSIPWMRKLREITGDRGAPPTPVDTFGASGLFHEPETQEFSTWEKLDLPGLMRFAEATRHPSVGESALAQVRDLFMSYGAQTGFLRLRHETSCLRARVDKSSLAQDVTPPDTMLLDFR